MNGPCLARPVSLSRNLFFDRLTEVNKAVKTSNSYSSAYVDTVEYELRSKSKPLHSKLFQRFRFL